MDSEGIINGEELGPHGGQSQVLEGRQHRFMDDRD